MLRHGLPREREEGEICLGLRDEGSSESAERPCGELATPVDGGPARAPHARPVAAGVPFPEQRLELRHAARIPAASTAKPAHTNLAQVAKLRPPSSRRANTPEDGRSAALSLLSPIRPAPLAGSRCAKDATGLSGCRDRPARARRAAHTRRSESGAAAARACRPAFRRRPWPLPPRGRRARLGTDPSCDGTVPA